MNRAPRGTKQEVSIVFRVTPEDKARINLLSQQRGVSMSTIVREALIETGTIESLYKPTA